jgi:hypothetical protein
MVPVFRLLLYFLIISLFIYSIASCFCHFYFHALLEFVNYDRCWCLHNNYDRSWCLHNNYDRSWCLHNNYDRSWCLYNNYDRSWCLHNNYDRSWCLHNNYDRSWCLHNYDRSWCLHNNYDRSWCLHNNSAPEWQGQWSCKDRMTGLFLKQKYMLAAGWCGNTSKHKRDHYDDAPVETTQVTLLLTYQNVTLSHQTYITIHLVHGVCLGMCNYVHISCQCKLMIHRSLSSYKWPKWMANTTAEYTPHNLHIGPHMHFR